MFICIFNKQIYLAGLTPSKPFSFDWDQSGIINPGVPIPHHWLVFEVAHRNYCYTEWEKFEIENRGCGRCEEGGSHFQSQALLHFSIACSSVLSTNGTLRGVIYGPHPSEPTLSLKTAAELEIRVAGTVIHIAGRPSGLYINHNLKRTISLCHLQYLRLLVWINLQRLGRSLRGMKKCRETSFFHPPPPPTSVRNPTLGSGLLKMTWDSREMWLIF